MRQFCLFFACFLLLTLTFASYVRADDDVPIEVQRLSERVLVLTDDPDWGEANFAIASSEGLVVIDTPASPESAIRIRRAIEEKFGRSDFAYVINTHHHYDHTSGNQAYPEAVIIGHESCREWMLSEMGRKDHILYLLNAYITRRRLSLEVLEPESNGAQILRSQRNRLGRLYEEISEHLVVTEPTITFSDRLTLDLGDLTLNLIYFGSAHSDSDILIGVPEEGLLVIGDLFTRSRIINYSSAIEVLDVPRWIASLNAVLEGGNSIEHIILNLGVTITREELALLRDYIRDLWEGIVVSKAEGLDLEAALDRLSLESGFSYLSWFDLDETELQHIHSLAIRLFWRHDRSSAASAIERALSESGIEAATATYNEITSSHRDDYYFAESQFIYLGNKLIEAGHVSEALEIFRMNVELFPESWSAWLNLGKASDWYAGLEERALECYRNAVGLNPYNPFLISLLKRSEGTSRDLQNETDVPLRYAPGESTGLQGEYLGQTPPGLEPQVFAPGIVSTHGDLEFNVTFSADGRELYYSTRNSGLVVCRWEEDGWTAPEATPFSGFEPHVTPGGDQMFFGRGPQIWVMDRIEGGWGEPRYHGPGMRATVTSEGTVYVTKTEGRHGICRSRLVDGNYTEPEILEGAINYPTPGVHPCIAADESFIIFDSSRFGGQGGEGDLYVCFRNGDGSWSEAINLGDSVNTSGTNFCASLSPDGRYLFFTKNWDIYWVSTELLETLRPE